jgi:hypothetical protein
MMERINRMSATTPLTPGQRIVVYTKGEVTPTAPSDPLAARELSAITSPAPTALPPLPVATTLANGARAVAQ